MVDCAAALVQEFHHFSTEKWHHKSEKRRGKEVIRLSLLRKGIITSMSCFKFSCHKLNKTYTKVLEITLIPGLSTHFTTYLCRNILSIASDLERQNIKPTRNFHLLKKTAAVQKSATLKIRSTYVNCLTQNKRASPSIPR